MKIGCVLLAAGAGRRFGGGKLLASVDGEPMIDHALRLYASIPFAARVCVTRAEERAISDSANRSGFSVAVNPDPDRGVGTSVSIGTYRAASIEPGLDGILYAVSDQPYLARESVMRLVAAFEIEPQKIVSLSCAGKRGNPAIFPGRLFRELEDLSEDIGGAAVIRRHPELLICVDAADEKELQDVDTPEAIG